MLWALLTLLIHNGLIRNKEIAVLFEENWSDLEYTISNSHRFSIELNIDISFSNSNGNITGKCRNFCDILYIMPGMYSSDQPNILQNIFAHSRPLSKQCIFLLYMNGSIDRENILSTINEASIIDKLLITSCVYIMNGDTLFELYYLKELQIFNQVSLINPSRVHRRSNFYLSTVSSGHVRNWSNYTLNGAETVKLSNSMTYIYLAYMQDFLNFSINFIANKDWTTMASRTKSGEIDIGISATGMTLSAAKELRFLTVPTYMEQLTAYYRLPDDESVPTVFLHTKPFSPDTWLITFAVVGILLLSHVKITKNMQFSFWYIVSCVTLHGYGTGGLKNSIRIVSFIGSLLFVILYASYSGELISSLSTRKEKAYNIKDLLDLGFTFGIRNDSYLAASKKNGEFSESSLAGRIFSRLNKGEYGQPNIPQGIHGIFSIVNYALITEENVFEVVNTGAKSSITNPLKSNNETVCKLFRYVPIPEYTVHQSPITSRSSSYVGYFNFARAHMKQTGIWNAEWKRREVRTNLIKPECSSSPTRPFFINDILLPLCIVTTGLFLSIMAIIIEMILNKSTTLFKNYQWKLNVGKSKKSQISNSNLDWQWFNERTIFLLPEVYRGK